MKAKYKVVIDNLVTNQRDYLEAFIYPQYFASHMEANKYYDKILGLLREGFKFLEFLSPRGRFIYNTSMLRSVKCCMVSPEDEEECIVNDDHRVEVRGV